MATEFDARRARREAVREGLATVASGLLLPLGLLKTRHRPRRARNIQTLVFVHGLLATRANFYPMQVYLRLAGHRRQFSANNGSRGSIKSMALALKRTIDANVRGGDVVLVAHSMGGLIARYYVQALAGDRRVSALITIGTPHHGTYASAYVPTALVAQMKPGSAFLSELNAMPEPRDVDTLSLGGTSDLVILPPESARCPFGKSELFEGLGHNSLLWSPQAFKAVAAAVA